MFIVSFLNIHKKWEKNIVTPYTCHLDTKITLRLTLPPFSLSCLLFSLLHSFPPPPPSFVVTIVMIAAVAAAAAEVLKSKPGPHVILPLATAHVTGYFEEAGSLCFAHSQKNPKKKMIMGGRGSGTGSSNLGSHPHCCGALGYSQPLWDSASLDWGWQWLTDLLGTEWDMIPKSSESGTDQGDGHFQFLLLGPRQFQWPSGWASRKSSRSWLGKLFLFKAKL